MTVCSVMRMNPDLTLNTILAEPEEIPEYQAPSIDLLKQFTTCPIVIGMGTYEISLYFDSYSKSNCPNDQMMYTFLFFFMM